MNSKKTIFKIIVHFLMILAVIISTASCNSNSDTTKTINGDSTITNDSAANKSNATAGHTNGGTDSMGNNTGTDSSLNKTTTTNSTAGDPAFMMKVAEINMEEIELGKLATQKAAASHVKELGEMMVAEHTQAMADLKSLAKTKGVTIPTTENEKIKADYKMLNAKTGKDFDKAYSDMMVNGHKEAIALFEKTNRETSDAGVKAMTTAMIPKLKKHLEHAEMCQRESAEM